MLTGKRGYKVKVDFNYTDINPDEYDILGYTWWWVSGEGSS